MYVCAIDASKAFDKLFRPILWQQLINNEIPTHTTLALIEYYESSLMMVSNNGMYSKIFKTTVGVRQGGVASPKLFSIYLDPILKKLAECEEGIKIGDIKLDILAYADDILIMNTTKKGLQKQLRIIEQIGTKLDIKFNPTKTVYMKFNNDEKDSVQTEPKLDGTTILKVDAMKYLGFDLDEQDKGVKHNVYFSICKTQQNWN